MIDPNSNSFWRRKKNSTPNIKYKLLLLLSIFVGACGQLFMKMGTKSLGGVSFHAGLIPGLIDIFTCPYIICGLLCAGIGVLLWLTVISKLELSFAYPVVALSYVLILLFGKFVFDERIATVRVLGIVCIMVGVVMISRTDKNNADTASGTKK